MSFLRRSLARVRTFFARFDWRDVLLMAGASSVFHGVYMLNRPTAWIVLGVALCWFSLFSSRGGK